MESRSVAGLGKQMATPTPKALVQSASPAGLGSEIRKTTGNLTTDRAPPIRKHRGSPVSVPFGRPRTFDGPGNGMPGPMGRVNLSIENPVTDTMSFQSNYFLTAQRSMVPVDEQDMASPLRLQLVFAWKEPHKIKFRAHGKIMRPTYKILNLPQLNYYLHSKEARAKSMFSSAWAAMKGWYLDGVVRTEEGEEDRIDYAHSANIDRLVNVTTRGRTKTPNIWGPDLRPMTRLWLIVKRIEVKEPRYALGPQMIPGAFLVDEKDSPAKGKPFRVIPWADPVRDVPSLRDLQYTDPGDDTIKFGEKIYVGRVESSYDGRERLGTKQINRMTLPSDTGAIVARDSVSILVDV